MIFLSFFIMATNFTIFNNDKTKVLVAAILLSIPALILKTKLAFLIIGLFILLVIIIVLAPIFLDAFSHWIRSSLNPDWDITITRVFEKSKRQFSSVISEGGRLKVINPKDFANKYEQKRAAQSDVPLATVTTFLISWFDWNLWGYGSIDLPLISLSLLILLLIISYLKLSFEPEVNILPVTS